MRKYKFFELKTILLTLILIFLGTFYLPTKSYSIPYFNIQTGTPPPTLELQKYPDRTTSIKICNPSLGPKLGKPLLFIDSRPTESADACGHFTFFNPVALAGDFLVYLLLASVLVLLIKHSRNN